MEISQEVSNNAIEIWSDLKREDGEPYCPANGTEGDIFESRWCDNCTKNSDEETCDILFGAYCDEQPGEWFYQDNKAVCTAFKKRGT